MDVSKQYFSQYFLISFTRLLFRWSGVCAREREFEFASVSSCVCIRKRMVYTTNSAEYTVRCTYAISLTDEKDIATQWCLVTQLSSSELLLSEVEIKYMYSVHGTHHKQQQQLEQ